MERAPRAFPKEQLPIVIDNLLVKTFGDDPTAIETGRRQCMRASGVQMVHDEQVYATEEAAHRFSITVQVTKEFSLSPIRLLQNIRARDLAGG